MICAVCGTEFLAKNPRYKTCSKGCRIANEDIMKKKRRLREYESKKLSRLKNAEYKVCPVCGGNYRAWPSSRQACSGSCTKYIQAHKNRDRASKFRKENPELAKSIKDSSISKKKDYYYRKSREWATLNQEKVKGYSLKSYYKNTETAVKHTLKSSLGFTPPPELVEEATALRLLRRAIKKAGE